MKEETYEKVYIKTEADLPEEDGFYIASCKNYAVLEYHYCNEVKRDWLKDIDWYLKPVEPVSDEYIEKWANSIEKIEEYMPFTLQTHIRKKIECRIEGAKAHRDGKIKKL